jgi:hypothetical protein
VRDLDSRIALLNAGEGRDRARLNQDRQAARRVDLERQREEAAQRLAGP